VCNRTHGSGQDIQTTLTRENSFNALSKWSQKGLLSPHFKPPGRFNVVSDPRRSRNSWPHTKRVPAFTN
jgi:hypothetical protein